jgi:general secretion pathway protein E
MNIPAELSDYISVNNESDVVRVDAAQLTRPDVRTILERFRKTGLYQIEKVDFKAVQKSNKHEAQLDAATQAINKAEMRRLLQEASEFKASDVHLVVSDEGTSVQFEVDGALRQLPTLSRDKGVAMIRATYQGMAIGDSSFMLKSFQNASIPQEAFDPRYGITGVRIQRGPCHPYDKDGEFMTLRLQYDSGGRKTKYRACNYPFPPPVSGDYHLGKMGYDERQVAMINELLCMPDGVTIVTGPTGSGKSTVIFNMLMQKLQTQPFLRLVTVEDPVEVTIPGAVQFAIQNVHSEHDRGKEFHKVMSVMLRMAPRWMFFGELRDEHVAHVALEAAVSGHGIFSTLHVADPFQWADRLSGMNTTGLLNRASFCDSRQVRGIIGQRLLGVLCTECSVPFEVVKDSRPLVRVVYDALQTWGDVSQVKFRGKGCANCGGSGLRNRTAVAEIIVTQTDFMNDLLKHGTDVARDNYHALPSSDLPMIERAINLVLEGKVDAFDVMDRVDVIRPKAA